MKQEENKNMSKAKGKINTKFIQEQTKRAVVDREWYSVRSLLGYNWAEFFVLLGGREAGKSYSVTKFFVHQWKTKHIPFYWIRLTEAATRKLLSNNAEKLVDPDIARHYELELTTKGNNVYDHGEKMATVLALSTFYSDKGQGMFDKDFLNDPNMRYHVSLDEFQKEKTEKSQGDICYQFVNEMENILRSTKERVRIFLIGNTLEEASDILTMFNFIPETFGRFKLHSKRAVIDYIAPSEKYLSRRKGTIADILSPEASTFTNKIDFDRTLLSKKRLVKPSYIIKFGRNKDTWFTVWDGKVVAPYNNECKKDGSVVPMVAYLDHVFSTDARDAVLATFHCRGFLFRNLITQKKFSKQLALLKPKG